MRPDVIYLSSQGYGQRRPARRGARVRPARRRLRGRHVALEPPRRAVSRRLLARASRPHRRQARRGRGARRPRAPAADGRGAAHRAGADARRRPSSSASSTWRRPLTGRPARPHGNAVDYACPHGVYPAAGTDRWVAIAVVGDDAWERLRRALGWAREPRLATLAGRLAVRAELDARVAAWTRGRGRRGGRGGCLQSVGVSAMAVQGPEDLRTDPHLAARGALVTIDDPEIGPVRHVANPLRLGRTPLVPPRPAPRLGRRHRRRARAAPRPRRLPRWPALVAEGVCR